MPQLASEVVVLGDDVASWSSVGGHKIGAWFASLGSKRGRRKAAAVAAAAANGLPPLPSSSSTSSASSTHCNSGNNNTTHRSFTLGKMTTTIVWLWSSFHRLLFLINTSEYFLLVPSAFTFFTSTLAAVDTHFHLATPFFYDHLLSRFTIYYG